MTKISQKRLAISIKADLFPVFTAIVARGGDRNQLSAQALLVSSHDVIVRPFIHANYSFFQGNRGETGDVFWKRHWTLKGRMIKADKKQLKGLHPMGELRAKEKSDLIQSLPM